MIAKTINLEVIYTLWLREMLHFARAKTRFLGSLGMPFFFLAFIGAGFNSATRFPGIPATANFTDFLAPGIVGMVLLFSSIFAGISVLWDKEFGFLKEIMVTPTSRVSIILGRTAGGVTTAMIQAAMILAISLGLGVRITSGVYALLAIPFMFLIACTFISLGLAFASKMEDMQGFTLIMNFLIFPLFFLSGALFPITALPLQVQYVCYFNPLFYGVDGLRGALIGISQLPIYLDFGILLSASILMTSLGAYLFEHTEVD